MVTKSDENADMHKLCTEFEEKLQKLQDQMNSIHHGTSADIQKLGDFDLRQAESF